MQSMQHHKEHLEHKIRSKLKSIKKKQALARAYRTQISGMKQDCIKLKHEKLQQQKWMRVLEEKRLKEAKKVTACEKFININMSPYLCLLLLLSLGYANWYDNQKAIEFNSTEMIKETLTTNSSVFVL